MRISNWSSDVCSSDLFDGRSFSNRRVVVRQDGNVIFNLTASFQRPAEGLSHQVAMPDLLPPEECWDFTDFIAADPPITDRQLAPLARRDRKRGESGRCVSVRVDLGGPPFTNKTNTD